MRHEFTNEDFSKLSKLKVKFFQMFFNKRLETPEDMRNYQDWREFEILVTNCVMSECEKAHFLNNNTYLQENLDKLHKEIEKKTQELISYKK